MRVFNNMCEAISTTNNVLIPFICKLKEDSNFAKREIIARVINIAIPFFMLADALANFGVAVGRICGRLLVTIKINFVNKESVSNDQILCNLKGVIVSFSIKPKKDSKPEVKNIAPIKDIPKVSESEENWELNKYFGHVYVINLTDRPDSKDPNKFKNKLANLKKNIEMVGGCALERVAATYGRYDLSKDVWSRVDDNSFSYEGDKLDSCRMGQAGCFMSHYRVIKDANENLKKAKKALEDAQIQCKEAQSDSEKEKAKTALEAAHKKVKQYSTILILEEDNRFGYLTKTDPSIPAVPTLKGTAEGFKKVMSELPKDWGIVYFCSVECGKDGPLGWMKAKSPSYSESLNQLQYGLLTNALAIHSDVYETILKSFSKIDDPNAKFNPVDHEYALLHKSIKAFTPKNPLAYQAPGDSAITFDMTNEPWNGTWDREVK